MSLPRLPLSGDAMESRSGDAAESSPETLSTENTRKPPNSIPSPTNRNKIESNKVSL